MILIMMREIPAREKDFSKIKTKNNICINVFSYENTLFFPIYISDQKFENFLDLFLVIDENKSHYVYIKEFNRNMGKFPRANYAYYDSPNLPVY